MADGISESNAGNVRDAFCWAASILLFAIVTVEVNAVSGALTTVVWIVIAIAIMEAGNLLESSTLKTQSMVAALLTFARALNVNCNQPWGDFLFTSGRTASVLFIAAGFLVMYFLAKGFEGESIFDNWKTEVGAVASVLSTILLCWLAFVETSPVIWAPAIWSAIMLFMLIIGIALRDKYLLYQSFILVGLVALGIITLIFPGRYTEGWRTACGISIAILFLSRIIWHKVSLNLQEYIVSDEAGAKLYTDMLPQLFSIPAAVLLAIFIVLALSGELSKYLSIAWAVEGLCLMLMGFSMRDRIMRFVGLGLLSLCIIRVFFDLWMLDIDRIYKVMALMGLGGILILIGWIYSRFREQITKLMVD
jgi:hypothetical protein